MKTQHIVLIIGICALGYFTHEFDERLSENRALANLRCMKPCQTYSCIDFCQESFPLTQRDNLLIAYHLGDKEWQKRIDQF